MERSPTEERLARWLDEFQAGFHPLERQLWEAWWQVSTAAGRENDERLAACVFRLPINGEMVSMCEVNAGGRRASIYAGTGHH